MKTVRLPLFALCASLMLPAPAFSAATVGQPAPDFTASGTDGKRHSLADYRGKYVVMEWVNPGCPFVRKHYSSGNMQTTQQEATRAGAVWLTINSTAKSSGDYLSAADMGQWMSEQKAAATATLLDTDGKVGMAYGAKTTPHMYIIDPQGKLIYAGAIDSKPSAKVEDIATATNYVRTSLQEALAGKPVSQANTKAYGCSVKYEG
ncbi:redoxin domain-containing protein [Azoarcus indigens]|uniref:Peroxiredoxin n=1 Tax=Azoarcus indigens TaxID=29545 RepID=A0A4V3BLH2_9RHOO|nr:thioredoxin family protein [Azoarcus indigens]NMG67799.1 redoxin domain-containing protein [Azoarcus indigens]TDN46792.1 peroxiredoxin [Azoarcus indigens]